MSKRPKPTPEQIQAKQEQEAIDRERRARKYEQWEAEQEAKGNLYPAEEREERLNRGIAALFAPSPLQRGKQSRRDI